MFPYLNNRSIVTVGARITCWWPLSPLRYLFYTTMSYSEDWVPWIDGESDPLTLPTIRSLDFLKTFQLIIGNQPSVIQLWSYSWSNMTLIFDLLDVTSLIRNFYLGLCFSQQIIIHHQDNVKLKWYWTIHHVQNQPNLCWINHSNTHINPSLTLWSPFKNFHS